MKGEKDFKTLKEFEDRCSDKIDIINTPFMLKIVSEALPKIVTKDFSRA